MRRVRPGGQTRFFFLLLRSYDLPAVPPDFRVFAQLEAFEKAHDPDGHHMRIGGICTTDGLDKQGERIIQHGLDFSPFLAEGWYNDNHGQRTIDVVGYPTDAKYVTKGEKLPNGKTADSNGWYTEGYLLNTDEGRRLWSLAQALQDGPRRLGFSIEGKVLRRSGANPKDITRAIVKNVAITHCPVAPGTELMPLIKALTAGAAVNSGDLHQGPGDGGALRVESLEGAPSNQEGDDEEEDEEEEDVLKADANATMPVMTAEELWRAWTPIIRKVAARPMRFSPSEAEIVIRDRFPDATPEQITRILEAAGGSS